MKEEEQRDDDENIKGMDQLLLVPYQQPVTRQHPVETKQSDADISVIVR